MAHRVPAWSVIVLSSLLLPGMARAEDGTKYHEAVLRQAGVQQANLLDVFRKRTPSPAETNRLLGLIGQLGADDYQQRVRAGKDLVAAGPNAAPLLRAALASRDPEVRRRAKWCLRDLDAKPETELLLSAAALTARQKPAGAARVLLDYLPFADEQVVDGLLPTLQAVGWPGGRLGPALKDAARAKAAAQRAAAAFALGRSARREERDRAAALLDDPDETVRWRAAQALLAGKDRRGLPGLLALVGKGSLQRADEAELLLQNVAGRSAPAEPLGEGEDERRKCHQAWLKWWHEHGAKVDLAKVKVDGVALGARLVAVSGGYGGGGAVWEIGPNRQRRWLLKDVGGPFDVRMLPGGKLLLAEEGARRVTERDRSGKVLWEHRLDHGPLEVQKLLSGNVLIVTNYEIIEVDRAGRVAATHVRDRAGNLYTGQVLPGGNLLYGRYTGEVIEQDRNGKQLRRFEIERPRGLANIVALPGGKYLIPYPRSGRIVEVDGTGKVTREVAVASPTCVAVLPDGNLLVGSHILGTVREIDHKGNVLWQHRAEGQVFRARVR